MKKQNIKDLARELRKNQTPEESLLWFHLRNRKFNGIKFNRQHPIIYGKYKNRKLFYIADFYCAEYKLILELDGLVHLEQKDYDEERDNTLKKLGYKILRIQNRDLNNLEKIKKLILANI